MPLGGESEGNASRGGRRRTAAGDDDVEQLLRAATDEELPEPSTDLIHRTIGRVRRLILLGDLLRLATLEGLWGHFSKQDADAESSDQRHN
jgi:hypothetical protein